MDYDEGPGLVRYPMSSVRDDTPDTDPSAPSPLPSVVNNRPMPPTRTSNTLIVQDAPSDTSESNSILSRSADKRGGSVDIAARHLALDGPTPVERSAQRQAEVLTKETTRYEPVDEWEYSDAGDESELEIPSSPQAGHAEPVNVDTSGTWVDGLIQSPDPLGYLTVFIENGKRGEEGWRYPCRQRDHRSNKGEECRKHYAQQRDLVRHIETYKERVVCDNCGSSLSRDDALLRHQREACGLQKQKKLRRRRG